MLPEIDRDFQSVKAEDTLKSRLQKLLSAHGFAKAGHIGFLRDITGLTYAGARKIFELDRLPSKREALSGLYTGLAKETGISENDIRRYLLVGGDLPKKSVGESYSIGKFLTDSPVYISKVILLIESISDDLGIHEMENIEPKEMDKVRYQVVSYCVKNKTDLKSEKLTTIITGLLEIAKESNIG